MATEAWEVISSSHGDDIADSRQSWRMPKRESSKFGASDSSIVWRSSTEPRTEPTRGQRAESESKLELPWIATGVRLGANQFEIDHIALVLVEIDRALYRKQFSLLSKALLSLPIEKFSPQLLVAVLRGAFPAREKLPTWPNAVKRVKAELERREINAENALSGLR